MGPEAAISRRRSRANTALEAVSGPRPSLGRRLFAPDPVSPDLGATGELIVARSRAIMIGVLMIVPLINFLMGPDPRVGIVVMTATAIALAYALGYLWLLGRAVYRPWFGMLTSLVDVTLVSAALMAFVLLQEPVTATNSRLIFDFYFLAVAATALRYDARVTLVAGVLAIAQYAAVIAIADIKYDLVAASPLSGPYGQFDWSTQASRVILLGAMTALGTTIVYRSRELRRLARSDRLTGLPNRIYLEERLATELARARRYEEPMALAILDVDHFKRFNDAWGHAAGDVVLRAVGQTLREAIRESDVAVRYGGEEFVLLLPGMDSTAALERAELLRRRMEATAIRIPRREEPGRVTISIGVSAYGIDGETPESLLDAADTRLFKAKEDGRNRVVGPPEAVRASEARSRASAPFLARGEV
jgi:two-component system, cell cycle response regulator